VKGFFAVDLIGDNPSFDNTRVGDAIFFC